MALFAVVSSIYMKQFFKWDNKAKKVNEIYRQVMEEWSH